MRRLAVTLTVILASGGALGAHHSYTAFDRLRSVTVTGIVEHVRFANPHVVLVLRSTEGQRFVVTWRSLSQLTNAGVTAAMVKQGDRLTVTGSPALDPARHEITMLRRVEGATQGWQWEGDRVIRGAGSRAGGP